MILTMVLCGVAAAALQSLKSQPENTPPRWYQSDDPCGDRSVGVAATIQGSLHCQY
jgi:hypothetical protein